VYRKGNVKNKDPNTSR